MAQIPMSKLTRQQRRKIERVLVRTSLSKTERRSLFRMRNPLKREIKEATIGMAMNRLQGGNE